MAAEKIPADIKKMSFEEALGELEDIVRELEGGDGDLDQSIASYTRGAHLRRHCETKLKDAQARVEKIVLAADGEIATDDLDPE